MVPGKRREDPCRELWRAAAVDQFEHRVQIEAAVMGQLARQLEMKAGAEQSAPTPLDDLLRRIGR